MGVIALTAEGGVRPYTFTYLDSNGTSHPASEGPLAVPVGRYDVIVTDANGCTASQQNIVISQPDLLVLQHSSTDASCFGGQGSITLSSTGGTFPFTFRLTNISGSTVEVSAGQSSFPAGTYSVDVIDGNSCSSAPQNITIAEPAQLQLSYTPTNATCYGSTTTITIGTSGGTLPYSYTWKNANNETVYQGDNSTVGGIVPGTYFIASADSKSCSASIEIVIGQTELLVVKPTAANALCFGESGKITFAAQGGVLPYTFSYKSSNGTIFSASAGQREVPEGSYEVAVSDANGCTSAQNVTITQPVVLSIALGEVNARCNNGSFSFSASGGSNSYSYYLAFSNGTNIPVTSPAQGLASDIYTLLVEDSNGCSVDTEVNLIPSGSVDLKLNKTDISCNGARDGTLHAYNRSQGVDYPLAVSWSFPNGSALTGSELSNLAQGSYTATFMGQDNCPISLSRTINEPSALSLTVVANKSCNDNAIISFSVSGGSPSYSFTLTPLSTGIPTPLSATYIDGLASDKYNLTIVDAHGCTIYEIIDLEASSPPVNLVLQHTDVTCKGAHDGSVSSFNDTVPIYVTWDLPFGDDIYGREVTYLGPGVYTATYLQEGFLCPIVQMITVTEPEQVFELNSVSTKKTDSTCVGDRMGSLTVAAKGGTFPYSYSWRNEEGEGVGTTPIVNGLNSGNYYLIASDSHGCNISSSFTINQLNNMNLRTNVIPVCHNNNDASASVSIESTLPPQGFTYSWTQFEEGTELSNSTAVSGLEKGRQYNVTAYDGQCYKYATVSIPATGPLEISLVTRSACDGNGTISFQIVGGTPSFTSSLQFSNGSTLPLASTYVGGLRGDSYTIVVSDQFTCTASAAVNLAPSATLGLSITGQNVTCYSSANGFLNTTVTNGTAPYSYLWSTMGSSSSLGGLAPGDYSVTVYDASGACSSAGGKIAQPSPIEISFVDVSAPSCVGCPTGKATVIPSGGNGGPYTFSWSNGANTSQLIAASGGYSVTVRDRLGCPSTSNVTIPSSNGFCGDGVVLGGEQCEPSATSPCCNSTCQFSPQGQVCRPQANDCDVADVCSGGSAFCSADAHVPDNTACTLTCMRNAVCSNGTCVSSTPLSCGPSSQCSQNSGECVCLNNSLPYPHCQPTPVLVNAKFSNNGTVIFLNFDSPTDLGNQPLGPSFNCSTLLDTPTIALLGSSPLCHWRNTSRLAATLGPNAVVQVGSRMRLISGIIKAELGGETGVQGEAFVISPDSPAVPTVSLSGATTVGSCDGIIINALVQNINGRQPIIRWSVTANTNIAALTEFLSTYTRLTLSVPNSYLVAGSTYTFQLATTNMFNQTGSSSFTVLKSPFSVPTISINSPSVITTLTSGALTLKGGVVISSCSPNSSLSYIWNITRAGPNTLVLSSTKANLQIPAFTLVPTASYIVSLTGFYTTIPTLNNTAIVSLTVLRSPLIPLIQGGTARTSSAFIPLSLNASSSYDPDSSSTPLNFSWTCSLGNGSACVGVGGVALSLPSTPTLTFPAYSLMGNTTYIFHLVVSSSDGRSANTSVSVEIVPGTPPAVRITPPLTAKVSSTVDFQILGSSTSTNVTYFWSERTGTLDMTNRANFLTSRSNANLVIKAGVLLPGAVYVFMLEATNLNGTGSASIEISVSTTPTGGVCVASPSAGYVYETPFTIECSGWQDDAQSTGLLYTFSYVFYPVQVFLGAGQTTPSLTTSLPLPPSSGALPLIVTISNAFQASISFTVYVTVNNLLLQDNETVSYIRNAYQNTIQNLQQYGDADTSVQTLLALASVLNSNNSDDASGLQEDIFGTFSSVISNLSDSSAAGQAGALSVLTSSSSQWNANTQQRVVNLVQNFTTSSPDASSTILQNLLISLSNLFSSRNNATNDGTGSSRKRAVSDSGNMTSYYESVRTAITQLSRSAVGGMVCGQDNNAVQSPHILILAGRVPISELQNTTFELPGLFATLPFNDTLFLGVECMDTRMALQPMQLFAETSPDLISQILSIEVAQQGGSDLKVANLSNPVTFVLPIVNASTSCNATSNCSVHCDYLVEHNNTWVDAGCAVKSSNATHVTCQCNHLTEFSLNFRRSTDSLTGAGDSITGVENSLPFLVEKPAAIIFVVILYVVFFGALGAAVYYDRNRDESSDFSDDFLTRSTRKLTATIGKGNTDKKPSKWQRLKTSIKIKLKTNHRWLRVFFRQRGDPFTRARRVTIVFNVIMTCLACNAIFYNARHKPTSISVGDRFLIAFWSSLLVMPINLAVFFMLSKASRRYVKVPSIDVPLHPMYQIPDPDQPSFPESSNRNTFTGKLKAIAFEPWPWWWEIIGYIVAFLVIFFSTFIIFIYAANFNTVSLNGWILSSCLSIIQDIIFNQPIASVAGAIFGTLFGNAMQKVVTVVSNFLRGATN